MNHPTLGYGFEFKLTFIHDRGYTIHTYPKSQVPEGSMINQILAYIGAGFITLWGIGHFFPTRNIVADFGDISEDNRNIITM